MSLAVIREWKLCVMLLLLENSGAVLLITTLTRNVMYPNSR
jgi:hypothetical protein